MPDLCRVCFVDDRKTQSILTSELCRVYGLLASNQVTEDGKPVALCYICYSLLQRCSTFSEMVQRSNQTLKYLLDNGIERTQESIAKLNRVKPFNLTVSKQNGISIDSTPELVSVGDTNTVTNSDVEKHPLTIKEETQDEREYLEIEIQGTDYDHSLQNPLELDASTEVVVNVPTTTLLNQLKKYMGDNELTESCQETEPKTEVTDNITVGEIMDSTHNIPIKKMKMYNECEVCHKVFHKRHDIDVHMRIHNGVRPYACNSCDQKFIQMTELNDHIRTEHTGFKKCSCTICNRTYTHTSYLKRHMETHMGKSLTCDVCEMMFNAKKELQRHMSTHNKQRFHCNDCLSVFKHKSSLKKHISTVHNNIKLFSCDICNDSFKSRSDVDKHSTIHIDRKLKRKMSCHDIAKPLSCEFCEFKTAYSFSMRNHLLRIHDIVK